MEDGLLSLKWNNHKTTFFEILKLLRDKANFTDATLAVDGKFYSVHKLVLSTCSEYFSEIFERTPCKSPVIVLKDVRSQDLESLLDYMYLGEVNVNQNDLALLLKTAECLRIKGLAVPDDDPTRHSSAPTMHTKILSNEDDVKDSPPSSKRRRGEDISSASSALSPSRISPTTRISASPSRTSSSSHTHKATSEACSPQRDPQQLDTAMVKVEMEETEGGEENFSSDNCDNNVDPENRDYIEKSEHDPSNYPNTNFSTQHTGDMQWEDGENSFPQESFGGDSTSQQAGGARTGMEPLGIVQVALATGGDVGDGGGSKENLKAMSLLKAQLLLDDDQFDFDVPDQAVTLPYNLQAQPVGDYPCIYCGKLFFYPSSLEKHVRTHTGEKPFKCNHCAYCASQKSHLKTHMLRKHNVTLGSDEEKGDKERD